MKTLSGITLCLLFFLRTIKSHTVAVCNSVAADGRTVTIYAGTYHSSGVPAGGLLLTAPGQNNAVEYMFDTFVADASNDGTPPYVLIISNWIYQTIPYINRYTEHVHNQE